MSDTKIDLLRHALGHGFGHEAPGWRNYYCAGVGSGEAAGWDAMCASGHAKKGRVINNGDDVYYCATDLGKEAARKGSLDPDAPEPVSELRDFVCTYGEWTRIVRAKTASKARYDYALDLSDCMSDPMFEIMRRISVRSMRAVRRAP